MGAGPFFIDSCPSSAPIFAFGLLITPLKFAEFVETVETAESVEVSVVSVESNAMPFSDPVKSTWVSTRTKGKNLIISVTSRGIFLGGTIGLM